MEILSDKGKVEDKVDDQIIKFDVRGKIISTYQSTISRIDSAYFKAILGVSGFKQTPQIDGSYFVDCNPDIFRWILGFIETGEYPHTDYNLKYIRKVCEKFDIPLKISIKKKVLIRDRIIKHLKETLKNKLVLQKPLHVFLEFIHFKENKTIQIVQGNTKENIYLFRHVNYNDGSFKTQRHYKQTDITISFKLPSESYREIKRTLNSNNLTDEFFSDFNIDNHSVTIELVNTINKFGLVLSFEPKISTDEPGIELPMPQ